MKFLGPIGPWLAGRLLAYRASRDAVARPIRCIARTRRGAIEVGKQADLIVIDRDPFHGATEELHATKVLMTFLDGAMIYQRHAD
jgi:imidazolonepropionase-like amidohydrolase